MSEPGFANILLSGPCNLQCVDCIGQQLEPAARLNTLDVFPQPGLDRLITRLQAERINQVSLTGINTEPMLYRHQGKLLDYLRSRMPDVKVSLHTNGTMILKQIETFNAYDRATISVASLDPRTCLLMTGSAAPLDLPAIAAAARIPLKVSTLLSPHNVAEIPALIERCRNVGIKRVVLRKLYGGGSPEAPADGWRARGEFAGNPVYDAGGIEVTVWDFSAARLRCVNLFPDGRVTDEYLLEAPAPGRARQIELAKLPPGIAAAHSIGVYLGSFDPVHWGHRWLAEELLARFDKLLLLIPGVHFHKQIAPPHNATLAQRLEMLEAIRALAPERIGTGIANEVLFLRLDCILQQLFPQAHIGYGMGDETAARVSQSESYYRRAGLPWTAADAADLRALQSRTLVFERGSPAPRGIPVPGEIRAISSTAVRESAAALWRSGLNLDGWAEALKPLVPPRVAEQIRAGGLYPG